jgi:large subunit ribosomal protein L14
MKYMKAHMGRPLPHCARVHACDNSGAKILRIIAVKGHKTRTGRMEAAGIGDIIFASVVEGKPEMRKQVVQAVIVRQKKEFRRPDGTRVKFADNAAAVLKDEFGNPKGTMIKGPVAKEVAERWPAIAKIASIIV